MRGQRNEQVSSGEVPLRGKLPPLLFLLSSQLRMATKELVCPGDRLCPTVRFPISTLEICCFLSLPAHTKKAPYTHRPSSAADLARL